jgi:hypothetical protein
LSRCLGYARSDQSDESRPGKLLEEGGTRQCSIAASSRSTMSPLMNVARMIFHDVVNSSDIPALTPAFPITATHCGYPWEASWMRSNALVASTIGRPPRILRPACPPHVPCCNQCHPAAPLDAGDRRRPPRGIAVRRDACIGHVDVDPCQSLGVGYSKHGDDGTIVPHHGREQESPTCMARFNAAAGGVTVVALAATVCAPSLPLEAAMPAPPVTADTSFVTLYASRQKRSTAEPVRTKQAGRHRFRSVLRLQ